MRPEVMMKIAEFLSPQAVISDLSATTKPGVLSELSASLARAQPSLRPERLVEVLREREKLGSTGIGEGVSRKGVDFEAIDGKPTYLFFALVAPENSAGIHLKALARISRLFKNPRFRESILKATTPEQIYSLIAEEDARA
jgi:PTS system nitrogen regulatory IIA component